MLSFLTFAALLLAAAAAHTSLGKLTSLTSLTLGSTVRIIDARPFEFMVDPGYPQAPNFTPVNSAPAMPTTATTNQDIYPALRRYGINFTQLKKITAGFVTGAMAMVWPLSSSTTFTAFRAGLR
ncbi:hypothetical protein C8F04DRAFT_1399515 [Mycena alexandri]|uniref:Uncharacterized protein n=1 Tax=Mycena alexandri TaxID=1745969 RepID=A0AAD6SI76_9AGAR|nr:hypothetical protein C8F04DRAFT_1399515 [Mycena alexandri]